MREIGIMIVPGDPDPNSSTLVMPNFDVGKFNVSDHITLTVTYGNDKIDVLTGTYLDDIKMTFADANAPDGYPTSFQLRLIKYEQDPFLKIYAYRDSASWIDAGKTMSIEVTSIVRNGEVIYPAPL